jgi:PleD family two-component response regulator
LEATKFSVSNAIVRRSIELKKSARIKIGDEKMAKAKILVVEDDAITARDIQDRLRDLGYDAPAIAVSGEEAIKNAEEIKPDLGSVTE